MAVAHKPNRIRDALIVGLLAVIALTNLATAVRPGVNPDLLTAINRVCDQLEVVAGEVHKLPQNSGTGIFGPASYCGEPTAAHGFTPLGSPVP
jgi:hypothetical protein